MRWTVALIALSVSLVAALAFAQGDPGSVSQRAFDKGVKLMQEGKPAEACEELLNSDTLEPAVATAYQLGLCHEQQGKLAAAARYFQEAARRARAAGDEKRAKAADSAAAEVARRTVVMVIAVPEPSRVPGLTITLGSKPVGPELWGKEQRMDPGRYSLVAIAPGRIAVTHELDATAPGARVEYALPPLLAAGAPEPPPAAPDAPDAKPAKSGRPGQWYAGLGLVIAGPIVTAVGLGLVAKSVAGDDRLTGIGATVLGIGATGTGIALLVVYRKKDEAAAVLEPWVLPAGAGVRVRF